ncbi:hypothetical protein W911_02080 [Hyphomicrobium nitrativorans NL23]|uniref:Uncharacterized protein n=1 Tax=Hyphomicrobium nitrativorans NL23 TaxID=1029756 RepID=V5SH82_9HYPH|nr:hypothetical protein W911_02080 [Hyphomicrobium nitrativorans NL23]
MSENKKQRAGARDATASPRQVPRPSTSARPLIRSFSQLAYETKRSASALGARLRARAKWRGHPPAPGSFSEASRNLCSEKNAYENKK